MQSAQAAQRALGRARMSAPGHYVVYGVPGWGSAIAEALLALCGVVPLIDDVTGFDRPGPARERLLRVNPLAQIPTLILPDGTIMTESAAIALLLAERFPGAALAPAPGDESRAQFLRRLIWLVANVYPTFTYGDYPERWVETEASRLKASIDAYRERLWRELEAALGSGTWMLGDQLSALDVYVAVMTHWRPRRRWFAEHCPRLSAIAARADEHPILRGVLRRNFPAAE